MPHPRPSGPAAARAVTVTAARLWQLALLRPQWLGAHLAAYASLVVDQVGPTRAAWRQRSLWTAVCAMALGVATVLAGVALMLWAVVPEASRGPVWVLWLTAAAPLALALWAWRRLSTAPALPLLEALKTQFDADAELLAVIPPPAPARPAPRVADDTASASQLLGRGALLTADVVLRPVARSYPWALVAGAAAVGALLVVGRPWRALLRPSFVTSLGAQWAVRALAQAALQSSRDSSQPAAVPQATPADPCQPAPPRA